MALFTDSEQRTFDQFLDSFDSPVATGQSASPPGTNGHFATGTHGKGHYSGFAGVGNGHGEGWAEPSPPPPPVTLGRSSASIGIPSSSSSSNTLYPTLSTHPLSQMPPYHPPGPSLSPETIAARPHRPQVTESQKRARMEQQRKDLEEWMNKAQPVGAGERQGMGREGADGPDVPSPLKRTRSDEAERRASQAQQQDSSGIGAGAGPSGNAVGRGRAPDRMDPLVMMLEAERRAGFRNVGIAAPGEAGDEFRAGAGRTGFAPPAPPPTSLALPPPLPLSTAVTASTSKATIPAPMTAAPTKRKKRSVAAIKQEVDDGPAPSTSLASSSSATPSAPGAPSDVNPNPAPALTPANIPSYPLRPRPKAARPAAAKARRAGSSTSPPPTKASGGGSGGKPALLTAEQKKANHIASEQKRRAAIRAGYDGLCEVVPALSAAVAEFEERVRRVAEEAQGKGGRKGRGASGRGRGGESTTGALMGGISVGGEKIDGRAGPKSEAVVLSKTVEHLRALLTTRATLLSQLSSLHAAASSQGLSIPAPTADGYGREWEQTWDDSMREEFGFAGGADGVKREDDEEDEEWEDA